MGSKIVVRWVVPFVALVSASAALAACSIDTSAPQVTVIVQQGDGGAASSPLVLDGGAPGSPVVDAGAEADASVDGHADGDAALAVDASIDLDASDASAELHFTGEAGASNWEQLGSLPTPGLGFGLDEFVPSGASELEAHSADAGYVYDIADGTWRTADPDPGVITGGYARARGTTYGMTSSLVVSHTEADDRWTALAFLGAPGTTFAITSAAVAHASDGRLFVLGTDGMLGTFDPAAPAKGLVTRVVRSDAFPGGVRWPRVVSDSRTGKLVVGGDAIQGSAQMFEIAPTGAHAIALGSSEQTFMDAALCGDRDGHVYVGQRLRDAPLGMRVYDLATEAFVSELVPPVFSLSGPMGTCTVAEDGFLYYLEPFGRFWRMKLEKR